VMGYCKNILPEAVSMRTHGLYQSTEFLFRAAEEYGIRYDASLFLSHASHLAPCPLDSNSKRLWRIPFFWEDDLEMLNPAPVWEAGDARLVRPGLKVYGFHPVHVVMNNTSLERYDLLKQGKPIKEWSPEYVKRQRSSGKGPGDLLLALTEQLADGGMFIKEVVSEWGLT
jgi:hypothetical protein